MKKSLLSLALATMTLAACGGGSSSSNDTPEKTVDPIAETSEKVAKEAGLTLIPGASADEVVYDVAADIGDSWRIILNTKTSQFTVKILQTVYDLQDIRGSFAASTENDITTFTGDGFKLRVDNRSKSATGVIQVGDQTAGVTGSGYAAGDLAKLAGIYSFSGVTRNATGNPDADIPVGQFKLGADGTLTVCEKGEFNASDECVAVADGVTPETSSAALEKDENTGVVSLVEEGRQVGIAHVLAGDRGPVLMIDRFGENQEGVDRTGVLFASRPVHLAGGELNGVYTCSNAQAQGEKGTIGVNGATATITNLGNGKTHEENVYYNKASDGTNLVDVNGFVTFMESGVSAEDAALVLPLTSTMFVAFSYDSTYVEHCVKP